VLVFHGIEGIGWEPTPAQKLEEYFKYIQSKENDIWVATFGDVARYVRERMNAAIKTHEGNDAITVTLTHTLNPEMYNLPLTLKTYVSPGWKQVTVKQDNKTQKVATAKDSKGSYVLYQARPNKGIITISKK
jgi:hypothetical protein